MTGTGVYSLDAERLRQFSMESLDPNPGERKNQADGTSE